MKTTIKMMLLAATAVVTACANSQPTPPCAVGHGGFGAQFTYVSGDNAASGSPCFRPGDMIGVQKYRQTDGTSDVYLKSLWLTEVDWNTNFPFGGDAAGMATGKLSGTHPVDGFCTVPTMAATTGTDPNGDDLTYTWSNVRFYVSGAIPGTQFTADLTITGTGCSAGGTTYTVAASYPVIFCSDYGVDQNSDGQITGAENDFTQNNANDAHCAPDEEGNPATDHVWSHLAGNPTFDLSCQPTRLATDTDLCRDFTNFGSGALGPTQPGLDCGQLHLCVPASAVPSVVSN